MFPSSRAALQRFQLALTRTRGHPGARECVCLRRIVGERGFDFAEIRPNAERDGRLRVLRPCSVFYDWNAYAMRCKKAQNLIRFVKR